MLDVLKSCRECNNSDRKSFNIFATNQEWKFTETARDLTPEPTILLFFWHSYRKSGNSIPWLKTTN